jgi:hypothetical protein
MKKWSFEKFLFGKETFWNSNEIVFDFEEEFKDAKFSSFFNLVIKLFLDNIELISDFESKKQNQTVKCKNFDENLRQSKEVNLNSENRDKDSDLDSYETIACKRKALEYSKYTIEINDKFFSKEIDESFFISIVKEFMIINNAKVKDISKEKKKFYFYDYLFPIFDNDVKYYSDKTFENEEIAFVNYMPQEEYKLVYQLYINNLTEYVKLFFELIKRKLTRKRPLRPISKI